MKKLFFVAIGLIGMVGANAQEKTDTP